MTLDHLQRGQGLALAYALAQQNFDPKAVNRVILLTDGYIANAAEPWKVPDMSTYQPFPVTFLDHVPEGGFKPYGRDNKLARPWVKPGTPGLRHRIGGIEKQVDTGHINYSPENHQAMTDLRKNKIDGVANHIPDQDVCLGTTSGKLALVGWGSTYGPIHQAVRRARAKGLDVSHIHLRHIWPMPKNLGELLKTFDFDESSDADVLACEQAVFNTLRREAGDLLGSKMTASLA
jgi:2-oxoglutarate ferredoxin oxidoreductase subunit alpha